MSILIHFAFFFRGNRRTPRVFLPFSGHSGLLVFYALLSSPHVHLPSRDIWNWRWTWAPWSMHCVRRQDWPISIHFVLDGNHWTPRPIPPGIFRIARLFRVVRVLKGWSFWRYPISTKAYPNYPRHTLLILLYVTVMFTRFTISYQILSLSSDIFNGFSSHIIAEPEASTSCCLLLQGPRCGLCCLHLPLCSWLTLEFEFWNWLNWLEIVRDLSAMLNWSWVSRLYVCRSSSMWAWYGTLRLGPCTWKAFLWSWTARGKRH